MVPDKSASAMLLVRPFQCSAEHTTSLSWSASLYCVHLIYESAQGPDFRHAMRVTFSVGRTFPLSAKLRNRLIICISCTEQHKKTAKGSNVTLQIFSKWLRYLTEKTRRLHCRNQPISARYWDNRIIWSREIQSLTICSSLYESGWYLLARARTHTHTHTHTNTHARVYTHIYKSTYICTYKHIRTYKHIHVRIYIYIYTYIRT